jgi:hypothetical protein
MRNACLKLSQKLAMKLLHFQTRVTQFYRCALLHPQRRH